jgi:hypothetical protein
LFQFSIHPGGRIHWCGPRQFLAYAPHLELIDLDARAAVCLYRFPKGYVPSREPGAEALHSDPAGRPWLSVPNPKPGPRRAAREWQRLTVPNPKSEADGVLTHEGREYLFQPGATVQVEVNLGEHDRSLGAAQRLAALLQAEG